MATARSEALRALAQRLADGLPAVAEEIVLTGSTSRGVADELSDVELLVVSEMLPPLWECLEWGARAGLRELDHWTPDGTLWWIGGRLDEEEAELIWWPREQVEQRIADILAAEAFDHQRLRTAEAIVGGIALRSGGGHRDWLERLAVYPDALAERVIADAAETWHETPRSERALLREGECLALARRLVEDAENVLRIVFALNRAWEPGWKRVARSLESLLLKPERAAERIEASLEALDLRAMRELVRETLALAPDTPAVVRAREQVESFLT